MAVTVGAIRQVSSGFSVPLRQIMGAIFEYV